MAGGWSQRLGAAGAPLEAPARDAWLRDLGLSSDDLRHTGVLLLASGVLCVIAGVAAIVVPAAASVGISVFIGWLLVFSGVVMGVHAFSRHSHDRPVLRVLNAALTLLVGLYLLVFPLSGTVTLTFLLAVWFFGIGALELVAAWRARGLPGTGFMAFHGAVSLVLGLLIALNLPSSAEWAIGLLVGINLIIWGTRAVVLGVAIRRLGREPAVT
jgi:uncharacterized membrane protein HdeD (DUF308 family)